MTVQTLAEMTRDEFQEMLEVVVERSVERKLRELLADPDAGLVLRESVQRQLLHQHQAIVEGARGVALEDVAQQLELT